MGIVMQSNVVFSVVVMLCLVHDASAGMLRHADTMPSIKAANKTVDWHDFLPGGKKAKNATGKVATTRSMAASSTSTTATTTTSVAATTTSTITSTTNVAHKKATTTTSHSSHKFHNHPNNANSAHRNSVKGQPPNKKYW